MAIENYTVLDAIPTRLNAETVHFLMDFGKTRSFYEGEVIVREGDKSDAVYIVLEGTLNVIKDDMYGNNNIIATAGKGAIFGEMGVFLDQKRSCTIASKTDLTVLELPNQGFLSALLKFPDLTFRLLKSLSSKLNDINEKLVGMINTQLMLVMGGYILDNLPTDKPKAQEEIKYDIRKVMSETKLDQHNVTSTLLNYKQIDIIKNLSFLENDNVKFKVSIPQLKYHLQDITGLSLNIDD